MIVPIPPINEMNRYCMNESSPKFSIIFHIYIKKNDNAKRPHKQQRKELPLK